MSLVGHYQPHATRNRIKSSRDPIRRKPRVPLPWATGEEEEEDKQSKCRKQDRKAFHHAFDHERLHVAW